MHEATIANSILGIATQRAQQIPGAEIKTIRIRLGTMTNVDPESLELAFDGLRQDYSGCERTTLSIEIVRAQATCLKRGHRYSPTFNQGFRCHRCGSGIGQLLAGREMDVVGCVVSVPDKEENENARIA